MAQQPSGQKSELPTAKRIQEARRRGQIPRSPDLVGWAGLFVASFILPPVLGGLGDVMSDYFGSIQDTLGAGEFEMAMQRTIDLIPGIGLAFVPFLVLMMAITIAGLAVQGGVTLTTEPLRPKLERISLKAGVKRLVSAQSAVDTGKAIFRLAVMIVIVAQVMTSQIAAYLGGPARSLEITGAEVGASLLFLLRVIALVGVVVGFGDYAFQRWRVRKQLMMTKDEVRRENKNTEGDPMIRGRRRALHQKLSQNQMLSAVNEASVVVVNPTHVAVALSYQAGGVPTVVAKGGDSLAAKIRERAFEYGVPVVEVRPLARILHDLTEIGDEVPAHLYEAVAIVIAFVMRSPRAGLSGAIRRVSIPSSKLQDQTAGMAGAAG